MNIDEFAKELAIKLWAKTEEEFEITKTSKYNGIELTGLRLTDNTISPVLYVDSSFEDYQNGRSTDSISDELYQVFLDCDNELITNGITDSLYTEHEKKLFVVAVNYKENLQLADKAPHERINDLMLIPRLLVSQDERGIASTIVTDDMMKTLQKSSTEIMQTAKENTLRLFSPKCIELGAAIEELEGENPSADIDMPSIYVIGNNQNINGAAMMAFPDVIVSLLKENGVNEDCYILPSSIHELLVVPQSLGEPEELAYMVREVNETAVRRQDFLSDNVYKLDMEERQITIAGREKELEREI